MLTGKSFSEELILASTKLCTQHLLSYCGLVDARISSSEKDLPFHDAVYNRKGLSTGIDLFWFKISNLQI